jgi:predicted RNA-binding Zn-ribbon protein involved in translation (DUF1610 family)
VSAPENRKTAEELAIEAAMDDPTSGECPRCGCRDLRTIPVLHCRHCGMRMAIASTRRAVRYHKCPGCGETDKSARSVTDL